MVLQRRRQRYGRLSEQVPGQKNRPDYQQGGVGGAPGRSHWTCTGGEKHHLRGGSTGPSAAKRNPQSGEERGDPDSPRSDARIPSAHRLLAAPGGLRHVPGFVSQAFLGPAVVLRSKPPRTSEPREWFSSCKIRRTARPGPEKASRGGEYREYRPELLLAPQSSKVKTVTAPTTGKTSRETQQSELRPELSFPAADSRKGEGSR